MAQTTTKTLREMPVEQRIAELFELSESDEELIPENYRLDFGLRGKIPKIPNEFFQRMLLLSSYISGTVLTPNTPQNIVSKEIQFAKELEMLSLMGTYTEERIYASVVWALANGWFDVSKSKYAYLKNLSGVYKILPRVPENLKAKTTGSEAEQKLADMENESFQYAFLDIMEVTDEE